MTARPPARPSLLPPSAWARWALALLVVFTVLQGGMWAMTQPVFWAPDEDYHFLYVEHLTTGHAFPSPDRPLYPREYPLVLEAMDYDSYASGPRDDFSGDPKASVGRLQGLSASDRRPSEVGRGVNVVHPPLYYAAGAVVNSALGDASPFTRVAAVRWMSAVLGGLAVLAAWLLAAQVFRRQWLQLTVAALVALQPMIGFLSGVVSNDIAVTAGFTGALAMMLFLLRTRPRAAQGLWLGGIVALALLAKPTALVLLPLAVLAYSGQAMLWRDNRREVARSAAIALGVVVVIAGWWYARSVVMYGSLTGVTTEVVPGGSGEPANAGNLLGLAWEWTRLTYRTYWWHFHAREAPGGLLLFAPFAVCAAAATGLALAAVRRRSAPGAARDPLVLQMLLMGAAILVLSLPPLGIDLLRRVNGEGFMLVAGRFMLAAYPAAVVLLLIGVRQLVPRRVFPWTCGALVAGAAAFCWTVWADTYVHRYFGHADWPELFRRMSFDRPEFVTPVTYAAVGVAMVCCLAAALTVVVARHNYDLPPVTDRFAAGPRPVMVVGASGLLGAYLHRSFADAGAVVGTGFQHVDEGLVPFDIRDETRMRRLLDEHRPQTVVCAAAVSNVERCEADPAASRAINVDGTLALARGAAEREATFVFLSSEYVFDGLDGPYDEDAPTQPLNEYGRQKQEVERLIPEITSGNYLIARVSCLYGHERVEKNFVYQLWAALADGREFRPPSDQIGTPTSVIDAADVIGHLVLGGHRGTFHVAGPEPMLRSEFALLAASELELDPALVRPTPTAELGLLAERPMDAGLATARVRAACRALCAPREGIAQMLSERPIGAPLLYAPR